MNITVFVSFVAGFFTSYILCRVYMNWYKKEIGRKATVLNETLEEIGKMAEELEKKLDIQKGTE